MASRIDLQSKLEEILGSRNVYFQPPENLKLNFPCIIYNLSKINIKKADNKPYLLNKSYSLMYIHHKADDEMVEQLLFEFDNISHDGQNRKDNLYYDMYKLYF